MNRKTRNKISTFFLGLLVFITLAFAALPVIAEQHRLTWAEPTEREDNTPLPRSEISHFNVLNSVDGVPVIQNIAGTLNEVIHNFPTGNHKVVMTAVDTDGRESVFSPILTINSATSPKSVTNFQAERITQ